MEAQKREVQNPYFCLKKELREHWWRELHLSGPQQKKRRGGRVRREGGGGGGRVRTEVMTDQTGA